MSERASLPSTPRSDTNLSPGPTGPPAERLWRSLVEHGWDAIVLLDADGTIRYASPAMTRILGYAVDDFVGRGALDLIHPDDRDRVASQLAQLLTQPHAGLTTAFRGRHQDGTWRWVETAVTNLLSEPGVQAILADFRDITGRHDLVEELRHRAAELEEAHRHKDEFLAMLGHELRNPLAPIRNVLHVLHRLGPDPATLSWAHDVTQRQVRHLTRLVDDLLDVSRISRGKIRLRCERLDLRDIVRGTAEDHRSDSEEAGLRLEIALPETPAWVVGDSTRLAQVVGNLLGNAVKFTDPGGRITVGMVLPEPGRVQVFVRDTGIGIEPAKLARIFDSFSQEERSLDRNRGGLGLGLALVKGLVELHGGAVKAASPGPGQGTEVAFWLPLEREPVAAYEQATPEPAASQGMRILIIEDYRDVAETLQRFLEFSGHQVTVAHSGPAGVAAARETQPDVVLCDLGLPGMDGLAVARALREDPLTSRARLIVMSGYGSESDQKRCLAAGYELHLTKPVDPEQLERILGGGD